MFVSLQSLRAPVRRRASSFCPLLVLLIMASSANAAIVITNVQLTVALDNTITITNHGNPNYFDDVGTAGNRPFVNGWGVSSGEIVWTDTNGNVAAKLNPSGIQIPVSNRVANSNGNVTGSVVLTASPVLGATLRQVFRGGTHTFASQFANGSITYDFSVTATIIKNTKTLVEGIELTVNSTTKVVTVDWSGLVSTANVLGSIGFNGSTALGNALVAQYGVGTSSFSSRVAPTDFYFNGIVTIPEPAPGLAFASALATLAVRRFAATRRRKGRTHA